MKFRVHPELDNSTKFPRWSKNEMAYISNSMRLLAGKTFDFKKVEGDVYDYKSIGAIGEEGWNWCKEWLIPVYESREELDVALSSGAISPSVYLDMLKELSKID